MSGLGRGLLSAVPSHSCAPGVSMSKLAPTGFSSETLRPGKENLSRRSERVTSPPFYLVDNLPPHVVDYLPLWVSNNPETESNLFMARSTC
jgi:hypothetical protein